jgi:hypothetical protein
MKRRHRRVEMPARGATSSASSTARAWRSATIAIAQLATVAAKAAMDGPTTPSPASAMCAARAMAVAKLATTKTIAVKMDTATPGDAKADMDPGTPKAAEKARAEKPDVESARKAHAVDHLNVAGQSPWSAADVVHRVPTVAMIAADRRRWPATGTAAIDAG